MTRQRTVRGLLVATLAGTLLVAASATQAQDATPGATPVPDPLVPVCQETGFVPTYQIVLASVPGPDGATPPETLDRIQDIVARRAAAISPDGCGVWRGDDGRILVQLAAFEDPDAAIETLTGMARLEIVDTGGVVPEPGAAVTIAAGDMTAATPAATPGASAPITGVAILTGADIVDAYIAQGASGSYQAGITLAPEAAARFAAYTAAHIGQPLAIVLDGRVVSTPVIQSEITGGELVIEGNFSLAETQALVFQLHSGALPAPLTAVEAWSLAPSAVAADPAATPGAAPAGADGEIAGVDVFTVESAAHTTEPVAYPQSPPVGGMHDPQWQSCGFYDAPVRNEHAVHTLEHGVVWITYAPDLPPAQVDALRQLAFIDDRLLVSPFPGLDAPVVLSSWDRQLRLDSVDDPRLLAFVAAYAGQSPEPTATCQGGIATPA